MTGRHSSTRIGPFVVTGPRTVRGALGDRAAEFRARNSQRPAGVPAGGLVRPCAAGGAGRGRIRAGVDSNGAARVEKMSLQAGMSFRISDLYQYISANFLKPESAYFSTGFGNVHPTPELGVE